ncbi:MAG: AraC family transcriptional regulator [Robiginitomaculum sp.]|nr:MAG: AraC family transcriptional regulator [Robiginitomaculum sp.]
MSDVNDSSPAIFAKYLGCKTPKKVILVAYDGVQPFDIIAASSVFARANELLAGSYAVVHASLHGGKIQSNSGIVLADLTALDSLHGSVDTIIVPGGTEQALRSLIDDDELLKWLKEMKPKTRRIGSVCTGAFLLAAAGLLTGRRAVTHWASCDQLAAAFPDVDVQSDALYILEDGLFTSAGVSASLDLSLALVEQDFGHLIAAEIARSMVLFLRRPGGQSQYSRALLAQTNECPVFEEIVTWIQDNLKSDLSLPQLAIKFGMSERSFARKFSKAIGNTPAAYVRAVRLEAARNLLETTDWSIDKVAKSAGFGSVDALERTMKKRLATTAMEVRRTFGTALSD